MGLEPFGSGRAFTRPSKGFPTEAMSMFDENQQEVTHDTSTPRWIGIAVVVLAVVSLVALGAGWTATNRSNSLAQSLAAQSQQLKQSQDQLGQRLAKAEDTNAQLQGELSLVTNKMKLTESELTRARFQAKKVKEDDAKQLAALQNDVNGALATKASTDDVNKLGTDVNGVRTDLETTKSSLNMTRGEFGTLIAKNHDQIEELRRLGERDYYEFTINRKGQREKVGDIMVELRNVNPKRNLYTVSLYVNDQRFDKKNRSVDEPIYFFAGGNHAPFEFTVNRVGKNKISGYLSVPKTNSTHAQAAGN
jgi:hypothetical protein